jgi:mRNA interferase MazF
MKTSRALHGRMALASNGPTNSATWRRIFTLSPMESPLIRPHEIYLASFPFGDTAGMKLRPVLTLTGPLGRTPEVLVAYISSVIPSNLLPTDIVLDPSTVGFRSTNLKTRSVLRLHKLATIHSSSLVRRLGQLPQHATGEVEQRLRVLLAI